MKFIVFKVGIVSWLLISCINIGQTQVIAPDLICIANDTLIWELPNNNCGAFNSYEVFGSQDISGPYNIIATITDPAQDRFFHEEASGSIWYYYLRSDFNCPGQEVFTSDTLDNLIPLGSPILYTSVEDENVLIEWELSPSPEATAYVILRNTITGTTAIDTVFMGSQYVDTSADPLNQTETYFVNALDPCGNSSLFEDAHTTILLQVDTIDPCNQSIDLSWNAYRGWASGVGNNEVWVSINGGAFEIIETLDGGATNFTYQNADDGSTYCFYVRATQAGAPEIGSNSGEVCETLDIVQPVRNFALKNASINPDSTIIIEWSWNTNAELQSYAITSATDNANFFEIDAVMPNLPLSAENTFVDNSIVEINGPIAYRITTTRCL